MKEVLRRDAVTTVRELLDVLTELVDETGDYTADTVYVTLNSDSVCLSFVEETLTDGSKVRNIELSEVCKVKR